MKPLLAALSLFFACSLAYANDANRAIVDAMNAEVKIDFPAEAYHNKNSFVWKLVDLKSMASGNVQVKTSAKTYLTILAKMDGISDADRKIIHSLIKKNKDGGAVALLKKAAATEPSADRKSNINSAIKDLEDALAKAASAQSLSREAQGAVRRWLDTVVALDRRQ